MDYDYIKSVIDLVTDALVLKRNEREAVHAIKGLEREVFKGILAETAEPTTEVGTDEDFWDYLTNPQSGGETTFISQLDYIFKWKKGWSYAWTGYTNEGKSTFLAYIILIKVLLSDSKAALFSPESFPRAKFYKYLVWTYLGRNPSECDKEEVLEAYHLISSKIYFIYPKKHDLDSIEEEFLALKRLDDSIDIFVKDPFLKISGYNQDNIAGAMKDYITRSDNFAKIHNVCDITVFHQRTPQVGSDGNYPQPDKYTIKGGGNISDGLDVVMTYWRPYKNSDPKNGLCKVITQKSKNTDICAEGIMNVDYDLKKNRYIFSGRDMFELLVHKKF